MKHYKQRGEIIQLRAIMMSNPYTNNWFTAVYVDYSSLHQQTKTRNLLDRIVSRAPDTVRGFDGLFAHFKHHF